MLGRNSWGRLTALLAVAAGFMAVVFTGPATAADTSSWLCKPGQADNPCLGKMDGQALLAQGGTAELGYAARTDTPVDCFYVYPTQSNQDTPNANLDPDQELKDVAINQARQFSRVCDVYAPLYRQYTFNGPVTPEVRDLAYGDVVKAWNDYLENYNNGRGVIIIGHSQGSSHLARMINEHVDNNPAVRDKVISAILPGANVYVPKGQKVGGQFQNIPACESATQLGCVIAYSAFLNEPPADSSFGRVESGYWINPNPRPDPAQYEVLCVNPAGISGENNIAEPLANLAVFLGTPESEKPWLQVPDYYRTECMNGGGANWLNVTKINPADARPDLADYVASGTGDLHLGDVNLALDNLVGLAQSETDAYVAREAERERIADATARRPGVVKKLKTARTSLKKRRTEVLKSNRLIKKATKKCKKAASRKAAPCKAKQRLARKKTRTKRRIKALNRQIGSLTRELKAIDDLIS